MGSRGERSGKSVSGPYRGGEVRGVAAGLLVAVAALIWITAVLFLGPGATASVLLPVLLLLLPLLGIGALCGWLVALAVNLIRGQQRR